MDFQSSFDVESLLSLVVSRKVGAQMLSPVREIYFRLNTAVDLVSSNELFLKSYTNESWRILEHIEAREKDIDLMHKGIFVHQSAQVGEDCQIGPNCYIGRNVVVGKGTRIANAIVLGGCEVSDYCVIKDCIVGFNCFVGRWARVEGDLPMMKVSVLGIGSRLEPEVHIYDCLVLPNKQAFVSYYNQTVL